MKRKGTVQVRRRSGSLRVFETYRVVLLGVCVAGCSDHRISPDELLVTQQQMRAPATPLETAPDVEAVQALIDRRMGPCRIGPADVLAVTLTGVDPTPPLPTVQARVGRNGEINLPIVGTVKVAGLELEDVEEAIRRAYVPDVVKDAVAYVELVREHTTQVLVVGAVTMPGLVPLRRNQRDVLHAIVAAGGVSELASGRATLRRIRKPGEETTLDLFDPAGIRSVLLLDPLERGDVVTVQAAAPNLVFVGGLVNRPRPQEYPPGVETTVLQAIAAAGGLRTDVTPREATLVRRLSDGTDAHVKLNLDRITTGKDTNLVLAAGDILWVPYTVETRAQDFINRNIFLRAGISVNYSVSGVEYLNRHRQQSGGGGAGGGLLQDSFDPFGFMGRNTSLQTLTSQPPPEP